MKKVWNVLTSWSFIGGLALLTTLALIVLLGEWFGWSTTVQLVAVVGVLVIAMVVLVVAMVRANKKAGELQTAITAQGDEQAQNASPDRRPEIEDLKRNLNNAIETLKTSKLGRGRRGTAALYALPWYMFIGPPGAGKTMAVHNSGLNFPFGADRVKGVGGTRNCDWFFSDQAILLDTAGRYMTDHENTEEWHAFLDALKEHRTSRPINGAIVGISASDLAGLPPDEIEWHANRIRQRIDELVERLGVRFPVYIVFTKCDLLNGFVEFFGDLTAEEREQVWGYTMTRSEQRQTPIHEVFGREFDVLVDRLLNRRDRRLSRDLSAEERSKSYVFPLEFAALRENLHTFVQQLFQPNPYQESPICRGFYFTSGTQEGVPVDHVTDKIAGTLGIPGEAGAADTPNPESDPESDDTSFEVEEPKSYFINGVFSDVVIPDQYLVQRTSRAARRTWLAQAAVLAVAALALGLFVFGAGRALFDSQDQLASVEQTARRVQTASWTAPAQPSEQFATLDRLRSQVDALEAYAQDPPLLRWGLDRGETVLEPARAVYLESVRTFVRDDPFQRLRSRLREATRANVLRRDERDALYADLKAYMLLTTEHERLGDTADRDFLRTHLPAQSRAVRQAADARRDALTKRVGAQVDAFAAGIVDGRVEPFAGDEALIEAARTLVYEPPSIDRLYTQIKQEGDARVPELTLSEILKGRYLELFATRPEVSGFFTRGGWKSFVEDAIEKETAVPDQIDWVMGYSEEDLPESMKNQEKVAEELKERYFNEYAAAWTQFLQDVRLKSFDSVRDAARSLNDLGNAYDSPLIYLLGSASYQTTLSEGQLDEVANRAEQAAERAAERQTRRLFGREAGRIDRDDEKKEPHPVDSRFKWLHDLKADEARSGSASPALMDALEAMSEVSAVLDEFAGDHAKAAAYAAGVLEAGSGTEIEGAVSDVRNAMRRFDQRARSHLFDTPLMNAWRQIVSDAQTHLNRRWRTDVHSFYEARLAGRYPFDATSDRDVPVSDFEQFFKPVEGTLATFRTETLSPFLTEGRLEPRTWQNVGVRLSSDARTTLQRAGEVGDQLFEAGVVQVAFELQPEQPESEGTAPPASQVYVEVHGQTATYDMGNYRPWTRFTWPGAPGAVLRVTTQGGDLTPIRHSGSWAWFRLLSDANVQRRTSTTYVLRWPLEQGVTARYTMRVQDSSTPFNDVQRLFQFVCPRELG